MGLKLRPLSRRRLLTFIMLMIVFLLLNIFFRGQMLFFGDVSELFVDRDEWYESSSDSCKLPINMDPYDPIIKPFIRKLGHKVTCIKNDDDDYQRFYNLYQGESLSYMNDHDPIVRVFRIKEHDKSLKCFYKTFNRDGTDDDKVSYSEEKPLKGHKLNLEKIGAEFVKIRCFLFGKMIYSNIHSWPSRVQTLFHNTSLFTQANQPKNTDATNTINDYNQNHDNFSVYKPSVMILVIESLSSLNFKRFMFKTSKALDKFPNLYKLRGLSKLADNTYPNMMPLLTGYRAYYQSWPYNTTHGEAGPYDEVPFIWKDFQRKEYATGYIEDHPPLSLFNYLSYGFTKPPVDWYVRPYWLQMYKEQGIESLTTCYKEKPKVLLWLKQIKQFLNKVNKTKQPFFLWTFYIQLTHENFNKAQLIDTYIASFLEAYRNILKDTVFILMGDHGNRFGSSLKTSYGIIESRMPFFSINLPQAMLSKHSHLEKFLKLNEKRLTTWLDIREILQDIVSDQYSPVVSSQTKSAYSPWREEIPANRTCQDALIPPEFCLCERWKSISINAKETQEASLVIVNTLNQRLSVYKKLCSKLTIKSIHRSKTLIQSRHSNNKTQHIEIMLTANPSNALFLAQLYRDKSTDDKSFGWLLLGDISRLNTYKNESFCIEDKVLRKYCYCQEYMHNTKK